MSMTSSKRSNLPSNGGDYFANLHDSIITRILSCLPTKDAVRTCVLSKDWKYKWTFSYNLDFEDTQPSSPHSHLSFLNSINRIIRLSTCLTTFRLICPSYLGENHLQSWISIALQHSLKRLIVCYIMHPPGIVYPSTLLNSNSLTEISLLHNHNACTSNVEVINYAPNLTRLRLQNVRIVNGNSNTRALTFNFPVLETLELRYCTWLNVGSVKICAPLLTTFVSWPMVIHQEYDYTLVLDAPMLTRVENGYGSPERITILNGSSVLSLTLSGSCPSNELLDNHVLPRVQNLINKLSCLEELMVWPHFVSAKEGTLIAHDKLRRLVVGRRCPVKKLLELLWAAPKLKSLKVFSLTEGDYNYEALEYIPSCIESYLEEVIFPDFQGGDEQYELAKFLLKNAKQLKDFSLTPGLRRPDVDLLKSWSTYATIQIIPSKRFN